MADTMLLKKNECVRCHDEAEATNVANYLFFENGMETLPHYSLPDGLQYIFYPQHGDGLAVSRGHCDKTIILYEEFLQRVESQNTGFSVTLDALL